MSRYPTILPDEESPELANLTWYQDEKGRYLRVDLGKLRDELEWLRGQYIRALAILTVARDNGDVSHSGTGSESGWSKPTGRTKVRCEVERRMESATLDIPIAWKAVLLNKQPGKLLPDMCNFPLEEQ